MTTLLPFAAEHERVVLPNVPRLSFDPKPELDGDVETTPFPSALRACMRGMGENYPYELLMGTSGGAFRLSWKDGWQPDNIDIMYTAADPMEVYARAFEAVGRTFESVGRDPGSVSEDELRNCVIESIRDKGRPVIAFGIVGPPEASVITGYDDGGKTLIGWSFFQGMDAFNAGVTFEPDGYFRKANWHDNTWGIMLVGDKQTPLPKHDVYRKALRWALTITRAPNLYAGTPLHGIDSFQNRHNGLAAYTAWAAHLLRDDDFKVDLPVLMERFSVHDDAVGTVAEGRWYAAMFMTLVAKTEANMASQLYAAASCYAREHELMWQIWDLVGGLGRDEKKAKEFAKADVRREMLPLIHEARDLDAEAARHIERALSMPKLW